MALSLQNLKQIVGGEAAAIRRIVTLKPTGGEHEKVYPPTYVGENGPEYAVEERVAEGGVISAALLDSVQSQANRFESALLEAYREGKLRMPLVAVDFRGLEGARDREELTTLEMPHRIADAAARDSFFNDKKFREAFEWHKATSSNATPLFELCPQALVFGLWDSGGSGGGMGTKFPRALVSEVVAYQVAQGVRPAGKLDPITPGSLGDAFLYKASDGTASLDVPEESSKGKSKDVKPLRPSEVNYGYIPPSLGSKPKGKSYIANLGGVTFARAEQTTVLSLNALRRLRFPVGGEQNPERNLAARTTLAALGLAATVLQGNDYFLRSRCDLYGKLTPFDVVGSEQELSFELNASEALDLFHSASEEAASLGLPWSTNKVLLKPGKALAEIVRRADLLMPAETDA